MDAKISRTNTLRLSLQSIPVEILQRILTFLDVEGLKSVCATSHHFANVFKESTLLRYRAALIEAGMVDISDSTTSSSLTIPAKLALLEQRQDSWRNLKFLSSVQRQVKTTFLTSSIYDFSNGVFILGECRLTMSMDMFRDSVALGFLDLSLLGSLGHDDSSPTCQHNVSTLWQRLEVDKDRIVDFGLALREHDLVALITEKPSSNGVGIFLHLRQLSTGLNHPLAKEPVIFLTRKPVSDSISVMIEVSGPALLLLVTTSHASIPMERDWLVQYNWYTGERIASDYSKQGTWHGFVFLSPQLVLLPNAYTHTFDVIQLTKPSLHRLYQDDTQPEHSEHSDGYECTFTKVLSLKLPRLVPGVSIIAFSLRSDPNPFGIAHPDAEKVSLNRRRGECATFLDAAGFVHTFVRGSPIASAPESALILVRVHTITDVIGIEISHLLFVHRSSILELVEERTAAVNEAVPGPIGVRDEAATGVPALEQMEVDQAAANAGIANQPGIVPFPGVNEVDAEMVALRERQRQALMDPTFEATSPREIVWSAWGPSCTRWVPRRLALPRWVTTACGQRTLLEAGSESRLLVWDFNPYAVKRERARRRAEAERMATSVEVNLTSETASEERLQEETVSVKVVDTESEYDTSPFPVFGERVVSRLPYVEAKTPPRFKFSGGSMLDDDVIIGLTGGHLENVLGVCVYSV